MPQLLEYLFDHHESLRCLPKSFTSCGFCSDECVDGPRKLHIVSFQLLRETERSAVHTGEQSCRADLTPQRLQGRRGQV